MLSAKNQISRISTIGEIYSSSFKNINDWIYCKDSSTKDESTEDSYAAAFFGKVLLSKLVEQEQTHLQHQSLSFDQYSEEYSWF